MSNGPLPPMYKRCDYLQAQGDRAVIDTGVAGNNDALKFDFCFNVDRFLTYRGFFTNYSSETANCWRLSAGTSETSVLYTSNTRTNASRYVTINYIGHKTTVIFDKSSFEITANGQTITQTTPITTGTANNTTIYINSSRRYAQTRDDIIKWYYFRIFDNWTLIRDYIPCIRVSDSIAGFYDTVNRTFNPSIGTVNFIAGYDN